MKRMLVKSVHLTCPNEEEDVAGQPAALLKFRAREMGRFVRLVVLIQARRCPSLSDRAPIQRRGITGKVWCDSDDFTEFPIRGATLCFLAQRTFQLLQIDRTYNTVHEHTYRSQATKRRPAVSDARITARDVGITNHGYSATSKQRRSLNAIQLSVRI
jgi:transposase InsO family protein